MQLVKPYDPAALVEALKAQGLQEAEKTAVIIVDTVCDWLTSSMKLSNTGVLGHLDDLAIPFVGMFQKFADEKLAALAAAPAPVIPADPVPAPAPADPAPSA